MGELRLSRREVLAAGAGLLRPALGANEKLDLAFMGVGGRGSENLKRLSAHNVVALCDVDWRPIRDPDWPRAAELAAHYPRAKRFVDFRRMLDRMHRSIDAVVISTPDHTHAAAAVAAMKLGKHVYCEKPLARSFFEVRAMVAAAGEHKVATQMGNQGHSSADVQLIVAWLRAGTIGTVREVHIAGRSAQGVRREANLALIRERPPVPAGLNWDLWLGPAPYRPFHPAYHPVGWRNFVAFGGGTIGDFTCHYLDPVYWALNLGLPESIEAETSATYDPEENTETFPDWATVRYVFRAGGSTIRVTWHADQDLPRPAGWAKGFPLPEAGGIVIGSTGALVFGRVMRGRADWPTPGMVRLYPEELDRAYRRPEPAIPLSPGHWNEWVKRCKSGRPTGSHFAYGGALSEIALLGNIAIRRKGRALRFDSRRFTNDNEANSMLRADDFRKGWSL